MRAGSPVTRDGRSGRGYRKLPPSSTGISTTCDGSGMRRRPVGEFASWLSASTHTLFSGGRLPPW